MKIINFLLPEDSRVQTQYTSGSGTSEKAFDIMKSILWIFISIILTKLLSDFL